METKELRELHQLYIQESNAFLECLRQKVSWSILDKKREKIREISRLIDEKSRQSKDPSSGNQRTS
jgi:GTPase SAR1 family protein